VGDFNGDGFPDLAVANYSGFTVTILLGHGDGTFTQAANSPIAVTFDPQSIVVSDFNGDGKADLAMENSFYDGVVTILLGNGDGTFTQAANSPITVGGSFETAGAVAVGDFNGDGIPDLVATNSNNVASDPGVMTVLLGKGDGTFTKTASSPVTVGSTPDSVAVDDLNGDGLPDLAMVNFVGNSVAILFSNGDGTFKPAASSPVTVGPSPDSVAVGDFNGDGKADLAVANSSFPLGGSVTVLLGNGSGAFTQAGNSPVTVGDRPESVVVGDFNGDGKADLASANNDDTVTVLEGNGDGTFTQAASSPVRVEDFPQSFAAGNFNGDGIQDLAVVNEGSNTVSVLLSHVTETTTAVATGIAPGGTGTHQVVASYPGDNSYGPSTSSPVALTAPQPIANPTFAITAPAVTIAPGAATATASVMVTPTGGFTGNVTLTAAITSSPAGAVDLPTVSINSANPVSITGTGAATATLTITTTPASSAALAHPAKDLWRMTGGTALACLLLCGMPAPRRRWRTMLGSMALFLALAGSALGCGGGSSGNAVGASSPGTTAGNYTVTVTGSAGTIKTTGMVTVTVQ
jgi:trimeric autotransporter adhesin